MISTERLSAYLNDHLGGSALAIDLARESQRQNASPSLTIYLTTLVEEIQRDRDTLVDIMKRLEIERSQVKEASGWIAEKLSRLKFQVSLGGEERVNRLLEIDALLTGIYGKQLLWQMLRRVAASEPRLSDYDFGKLEARAAEQIDALNSRRLETFGELFDTDG